MSGDGGAGEEVGGVGVCGGGTEFGGFCAVGFGGCLGGVCLCLRPFGREVVIRFFVTFHHMIWMIKAMVNDSRGFSRAR